MKNILSTLKKHGLKIIIILPVILIALGSLVQMFTNDTRKAIAAEATDKAYVERVNLSSSISGSGIIEPLDTYTITALIEGEITEANFEEGDFVEKDQVLYRINTKNLDSKIEEAQLGILRAERNYNNAVKEYNDSQSLRESLQVRAGTSGQLVALNVEVGDLVTAGVPIGQIIESNILHLNLFFPANKVDSSLVGQSAHIELPQTLQSFTGTISAVSQNEEMIENQSAKTVTIDVINTDNISIGAIAIARINEISSISPGAFEPSKQKPIIAKSSGEVKSVSVQVNSQVTQNQLILSLDTRSVEKQIESYKNSVTVAYDAVIDAKKALENLQINSDNYQIKSPVTGQVITKQMTTGEHIAAMTPLAVVYDMSIYRFKMYIDELDIAKVTVGQQVEVSADAAPGQVFNSYIEKISLEAANNNGITQYPVIVRMAEKGTLLPSMTVNADIIVGKKEAVLAIPVAALMRGNFVYVRDELSTVADGDVPAGYSKVEVVVGAANSQYIEIISGLSEGQEIYIK
ncbi:hypothetical protein FACS189418_3570 [Clostridia bacterium]|nr:hypothetical protein FACS189418_3570 [Clostridia bacterium]